MEYLKINVPVEMPRALKAVPHGCALVCSMYADEILKKLKKMGYGKPVITMHPRAALYQGEK